MVKMQRIETPVTDYRYVPSALAELPQESYGHRLRRLRLTLGLTQAEVAVIARCSKQTISLWERDKRLGVSAQAAALPRYAIALLSGRLRRKQIRDAALSTSLAKLPVGRNGHT